MKGVEIEGGEELSGEKEGRSVEDREIEEEEGESDGSFTKGRQDHKSASDVTQVEGKGMSEAESGTIMELARAEVERSKRETGIELGKETNAGTERGTRGIGEITGHKRAAGETETFGEKERFGKSDGEWVLDGLAIAEGFSGGTNGDSTTLGRAGPSRLENLPP